jgi:hypothetical protein
MKIFGRDDGAIDERRRGRVALVALEDQAQRPLISPDMTQRYGGDIADGGFVHAGKSFSATKNLAKKRSFLRDGVVDVGFWVIGDRQPDADGHGVLGVEAGADVEEVPKAAKKEAGGDHENEREGEFGDDQQAASAVLLAGAGAARFAFEHAEEIELAALQRGGEAEDGAGGERGENREQEDGPVDGDFVESREGIGNEAEEEFLSGEENGEAGKSTDERKEQTFGEELGDEAMTRGAEGLAKSDFAAASAGASKEKIGNVDAANEKNEADGAKQKDERLTNIAHDGFLHRDKADVPAILRRVIGRELFLEIGDECVDLALRCGEGEARLQTGDTGLKGVIAVKGRGRGSGGEAGGKPSFRVAFFGSATGIMKVGRHDADDAVEIAVEAKARFQRPSLMMASRLKPGVRSLGSKEWPS